MNILTPLTSVHKGQKCIVKMLLSECTIKRRLQDMGITEGSEIEYAIKSPLGDPCAYVVKGTLIAIRNDDAKNILVSIKE